MMSHEHGAAATSYDMDHAGGTGDQRDADDWLFGASGRSGFAQQFGHERHAHVLRTSFHGGLSR